MENCHICGTQKVLKPAGVNRNTGKPYEAFVACPNYKNHPKPTVKESAYDIEPSAASLALVMGEFKNLNERFDKLGKYLVGKLGAEEIKKMEF